MHLVNTTERELKDAITELQSTQEKLIISEKMASLGSLVSGVGHEVNTPLGVSLTGISQVSFEVDKLYKGYNEDELTEEQFESTLTTLKELTKTIHSSLENAANIINSFKHIAVDQNIDDRREFNLKEYLDEIAISLRNEFKRKQVKFVNNIDEKIELNSYPGTVTQIMTNLMLNSIKHGFEYGQENTIEVSSQKEEDGSVILHYKDNGKGISQEVEKKIFDPFFTTARGQGGSGLGMNIVYNLITEKLHSEISIEPSAKGLHFKIKINPDMVLKA
jgi:signal transduction histidine kinase